MNNIILIGMPSCGKSVTGVVLAKALNMRFTDTDLLIQEKAGKSLQQIINEDGIEAFKTLEKEVLIGIDAENTVIATGGSAVYYQEAMENLKKKGCVVYIEASLRTVKKRLRNIKTRGVAMAKGQTLEDLYKIRVPLYKKICRCNSVHRQWFHGRDCIADNQKTEIKVDYFDALTSSSADLMVVSVMLAPPNSLAISRIFSFSDRDKTVVKVILSSDFFSIL